MKTHELAENLENLAKLLKCLPDAELGDSISDISKLINDRDRKNTKNKNTRTVEIINYDMEEKLPKMKPIEIEKLLDRTDDFPTKRLVELAKRIGLSTSQRQSRSALVNLIARHYEAGQMDLMMRNAKKDEHRNKKEADDATEPTVKKLL